MTIVKQLVQFAIYPVAMGAAVGLCLWVLLGLLQIDRFGRCELPACDPVPKRVLAPASTPGWKAGNFGIGAVPGDRGPLVTQMQGALVKKGYSIGRAGADGNFNDDTLTALEAFQDDNALPVQPNCDRQCWTALGLSRPN